jgi:hypothetical protein
LVAAITPNATAKIPAMHMLMTRTKAAVMDPLVGAMPRPYAAADEVSVNALRFGRFRARHRLPRPAMSVIYRIA